MTNGEIELIAIANGFERKKQPDGTMELHPHVYDFARALLAYGVRPVASVKIREDSTTYRASIYWLDEALPDGTLLSVYPLREEAPCDND